MAAAAQALCSERDLPALTQKRYILEQLGRPRGVWRWRPGQPSPVLSPRAPAGPAATARSWRSESRSQGRRLIDMLTDEHLPSS